MFARGQSVDGIVIPGEVFPTRYRSTAHGISAASGKLGGESGSSAYGLELMLAIVAQVGFARLIDIGGKTGEHKFLKHIMELFAFFMYVSTPLVE